MTKPWKPYLAGFGTAMALVVATLALTLGYGFGAWGGPSIVNKHSELDTTNAIARQFGISIVWTDDFRNCAVTSTETLGGCFQEKTPNTIYVSPELMPRTKLYVMMHEIGHVIQYRFQVPRDECAADRFAQLAGYKMGTYCPPDD